LNAGYKDNENKIDEEKNIWHASAAVTCEIIKNLKLAGNIGIERNTDRKADRDPAFILGGVIYSVTESLDIDVGIKYGLTAPETDLSFLVGTAFRF
jgi:hypothetical protein